MNETFKNSPEEQSGGTPNAATQTTESSPSESAASLTIDKDLEIPNNETLCEIATLAELKTERERRFVYAIATLGLLPARAAEVAGYSARETFVRTARDLIKKPKILHALNKLSDNTKLPKWWLLKNLEEVIENPIVPVYKHGECVGEKLDMNLKFKAMQEANKIAGLYATEEQREFKPLITQEELEERFQKSLKVVSREPIV